MYDNRKKLTEGAMFTEIRTLTDKYKIKVINDIQHIYNCNTVLTNYQILHKI